MNKDELIFDWSNEEVHQGWKGASVLVAVLGFGLVFSVISVKFDRRDVASVNSASVLYLADDKEGRIWRMKTEEEGPFPGRLEISVLYDPLDEIGVGTLGDDSWNSYEVTMRSLNMDSAITASRISAQGKRFFPRNFKSTDLVKAPTQSEVVLSPKLVPYTTESEKWLPTRFPPFNMLMKDEIVSAEWRFVLNLRADGTVMECLSLSGGSEEGLAPMITWLKSLRFQESEESERWMGLRIEFLNERKHGANPD